MRLRSGAGTVLTCAPSTDRPCACPTRRTPSPASARCSRRTAIPPPWRGSPRSTIRSNGLILDALIAPYHRDQRDLLFEHLAALEAGCLLLLDRGYPAFRVF